MKACAGHGVSVLERGAGGAVRSGQRKRRPARWRMHGDRRLHQEARPAAAMRMGVFHVERRSPRAPGTCAREDFARHRGVLCPKAPPVACSTWNMDARRAHQSRHEESGLHLGARYADGGGTACSTWNTKKAVVTRGVREQRWGQRMRGTGVVRGCRVPRGTRRCGVRMAERARRRPYPEARQVDDAWVPCSTWNVKAAGA
jgi:hypothetical protein